VSSSGFPFLIESPPVEQPVVNRRYAMSTAPAHSQARGRMSTLKYQPRRRPEWDGLGREEILKLHPPARTPPLVVLELLISLYNKEHTAREKEVSFKTREERAQFLRRFFRALKSKAGFPTLPDPRNLGQRHVQAVVAVWQEEKLAAPTIQTYLSFLRGFAQWIGKRGLIRQPQDYGLRPEQYIRHAAADYDKSWTAHEVDIATLLAKICLDDARIGAMLRLMWAYALRKKEAIMLRPHLSVWLFETTGLSLEKKKADCYLRVKPGSKGGRERFIPIDTPERVAAIDYAKSVVSSSDGHMGDPARTLKQNMVRFDNVMKKFGITKGKLGVTSHGLRHGALIDRYHKLTGEAPPVRGGVKLPNEIDTPARLEVAELAGHARPAISASYVGK
jgi:integrase